MAKAIKERLVSVEEFAEIAGTTPRTVYNWSARRIIPKIERSQLPLLASCKALVKYLRDNDRENASERAVTEQRTRLLRARADIAEQERQALFDRLIPVSEIEAGFQYLRSVIIDPLRALPARVAPNLVGVKSPAQAQAILTVEVHATLSEIARTPLAIKRTRAPWDEQSRRLTSARGR